MREPSSNFRKLLEGRWPALGRLAAISLASGLTEALFLVVVVRATFALTSGDGQVEIPFGSSISVNNALLVCAGLAAIRTLLSVSGAFLAAKFGTTAVADIRRSLARAFVNAAWPVQQAEKSGRLQELLTTFITNVVQMLSSLAQMVTMSFSLIALLAAGVAIDPAVSILAIISVGLLGSALRPFRAAIKRQSTKFAASGSDLASSLSDISQLGLEVHAYQVQQQVSEGIDRLIETNRVVGQRLSTLKGLVLPLYTALAYLALIGALAVISAAGSGQLESLGAVMLVMLRSLSYGQSLQNARATIATGSPYLEMLYEELSRFAAAAPPPGDQPVDDLKTLELRDVSFEYVAGRPVLSAISLRIGPNELVGIVGPSGSGKSTLVQLLLGLREPTRGVVLADGSALAALSRADWAKRVTFVPQTPHLISGTVADNIRFYRPHVSDASIERAARLAHIHDEIIERSLGYQSQVGERGGALSGGQQQRLCIARALVDSPQVLILDEPTSALDPRSEALIRETLRDLGPRMTVIVIAHRLSTLDICDRIMVIQDGVLKAFDTPQHLEDTNAFFQEALRLSGMR